MLKFMLLLLGGLGRLNCYLLLLGRMFGIKVDADKLIFAVGWEWRDCIVGGVLRDCDRYF